MVAKTLILNHLTHKESKMKKLHVLLLAGLVMGSASVASAQDAQPQPQGQGGANRRVGPNMTMQGITLSADQQVKMDSIASKYSGLRRAITSDQTIEGPAKREKVRELLGTMQDEIKCILTAEQKTVYEKNLAEMESRMQQGGGQRPPQD
jgi:Spy/CpxP family protein refolding chaperone